MQLTRQLVEQDKAFALFGSLGTQAQTSVRQYLNDHRVPQLFVSSGAITWGLDHRRYRWSMGMESIIYSRYVRQNLPAAKIMVADLLADHHEPERVAQIVREVLDQVYDYPRVVAAKLGPFATQFNLPRNDGIGLLDLLLTMAGHPYRDRLLAEARS